MMPCLANVIKIDGHFDENHSHRSIREPKALIEILLKSMVPIVGHIFMEPHFQLWLCWDQIILLHVTVFPNSIKTDWIIVKELWINQ